MGDNETIYNLSKSFALRIINLYKFLVLKNEYVMSKQVLRSGTSIGANIVESKNAQSKLDFISKLNIALKEADETEYWLDLLRLADYIDDTAYESIVDDNRHIIGVLVKIIKTTKLNGTK